MGLVQNLGTGVKDFFYEPFEGMSEGSLEAFLSGLGKGTNSLLGNTMEGTFTAASKITGTLGHGLASLTLDRRYNHDRARRRAQEAQNVSEGIKQVSEPTVTMMVFNLNLTVTCPNTHTQTHTITGRARAGAGLLRGRHRRRLGACAGRGARRCHGLRQGPRKG